ncbi:hypothetical protein [Xanthomarina sp. GH4-25]|uniref:hypothetical protein n=1 Tax=Xanthomarina sp. GH4-25 TaxID=3349335 RepID=UPI0038780445
MKKNNFLSKFQILFIAILLISLSATAQVGIGTISPTTTLDVEGAVSFREGAAINLTATNNDNVSLGAGIPYSFYRITGATGNFNISGIVPLNTPNPANGQVVTLENTTAHTLTLMHNTTSIGSNRILCPGGTNFTLVGQYATVTLQYNTTQNRWLIVNYADSKYGDNIQYSIGTSDIQRNSINWADMADMSITFIPKHSVVYVNFSASGHMNTSAETSYVNFRLVDDTSGTNIHIAGLTSLSTDTDNDSWSGTYQIATSWNAHFTMYPVVVTPGVSITLRIQWRRDGNSPSVAYNSVSSLPDYSHRSITILD